jgi:hypothetical protein
VVYVDANLLRENINIIKKDTEPLLDASKDVGMEADAEKTKYMFISHCQTAGKNHYIKVAKPKYFGKMLTNKNCVHEEIKSRLNLGR